MSTFFVFAFSKNITFLNGAVKEKGCPPPVTHFRGFIWCTRLNLKVSVKTFIAVLRASTPRMEADRAARHGEGIYSRALPLSNVNLPSKHQNKGSHELMH